MKERVTLTLERDILEKVDKTINKADVKNRSHAIELLLAKALGGNRPSKAVILAGGPIDKSRTNGGIIPRPMIRVQDKPLLEHNINLLKEYDIKNIIISIGPKGDHIRDYFGDGSQLGVHITYVEEESPLGTGGPLNLLKEKLNDTFILMNGDELKNIDLEDMFIFHRKNKGAATIALTTTENPSTYGVAVMNGQKIMAFIEKPSKDNTPSKLINAGLYILEPEVLKAIPEGFSMLEQDVFPKMAMQEKLIGYVFSGQWFDTTTPGKLTEAERYWQGFK